MGNILHDWNLEKKQILIRKAYDALPDGGAFITIENVIDDARRENVFGLLMSMPMRISCSTCWTKKRSIMPDQWSWA